MGVDQGGFFASDPTHGKGFKKPQEQRRRGILQRRFWEHWIRDQRDYRRHVDYIHYNPVKHGYVATPVDWPYSSIHRFIRQGIITPDWAANVDDGASGFGKW